MTAKSRKLVLVIAIAVAGSIAGLVAFAPGRADTLEGPVVQLLRPDGFTLVWRQPHAGPATVSVKGADLIDVQTVEPTEGRYEVTIDGLKAATPYKYSIHDQQGGQQALVAAATVRTAPRRGGTFRFLAFGDSQGGEAQSALAKLMEQVSDPAPELILHLGDLVYPDGRTKRYDEQVYKPYAALLRRMAFYPTLGNHDFDDTAGVPMCEQFVLPTNGPAGAVPERNYWFDIGDVRFVAFNSNETFEVIRDQTVPWLDHVLADAGDRWKVVFFHHPIFTNGKYHGSGKLRTLVVPLFDRYGVALALSGHNHMYERSRPLRAGKIVEPGRGTVYVTSGAGGFKLYAIPKPKPPELVLHVNTQHSFSVVEVSLAALRFRQVGMDGSELDSFQIDHRAARPTSTSRPHGPSSVPVGR